MTTLIPAYGRDYKSGKAAKDAFASGLDFIIANAFSRDDGRAASIADFKVGETVLIRFKRLTGVTSFRVTAKAQAEAVRAVCQRLRPLGCCTLRGGVCGCVVVGACAHSVAPDCTCGGYDADGDCPACGC